jgi:hypothetical protein
MGFVLSSLSVHGERGLFYSIPGEPVRPVCEKSTRYQGYKGSKSTSCLSLSTLPLSTWKFGRWGRPT